MSSRSPVEVRSSLEAFARHGGLEAPHKVGWGLAYYAGEDVRLTKDSEPASGSECVRFIHEHPFVSGVVISHIRKATQGRLAMKNCQPFARELGGRMHVFAHNGDLDLARLRTAACAARWIELATETETPLPEVFTLMRNLLAMLDTKPAGASMVFAFELALLSISGFGPALDRTSLSAGARKALTRLTAADWVQLDRLKLSEAQVSEIERFLRQCLLEAWRTLPPGRAEALGLDAARGLLP